MNYLHSHGLAHTELRLENVHISPLDGHVKVSVTSLLAFISCFIKNYLNLSSYESHKALTFVRMLTVNVDEYLVYLCIFYI